MTLRHGTLAIALLAGALGCATTSSGGSGAKAGAPAPSSSAARPAATGRAAAGASGGEAGPAREAAEPSPRAQRLFEDAVRAQEDQKKLKVPTDWELLERKWRAVIEAGDLAEARHNLAVALAEQGRTAEARAEYERALALKPSLRQSAVNLGVLLERGGDSRAAAAAYQAVLRDFPEDALARERLASLYLSSGQLDEAWRLAREALLRDPRSIGAHEVLARVAMKRGEIDLARLVLLRAQKIAPDDAELAFLEGEALARQGDAAAAADRYRRALQLDTRHGAARAALLQSALEKESWPKVAEHTQAIVAADPKNARAHLALGVAYRHLGKTEEAAAAYDRAEKLGGDDLPEVLLARGVLQMRAQSSCEPALSSFQAYLRAAGPGMPRDGRVTKLQRECEQILEQNRQAAEAARQMKAEGDKKPAGDGRKGEGDAAPVDGRAAPTPAPTAR